MGSHGCRCFCSCSLCRFQPSRAHTARPLVNLSSIHGSSFIPGKRTLSLPLPALISWGSGQTCVLLQVASPACTYPLRPQAYVWDAALMSVLTLLPCFFPCSNLTFFHDALGGCERLLRAPIPLSYTRCVVALL